MGKIAVDLAVNLRKEKAPLPTPVISGDIKNTKKK